MACSDRQQKGGGRGKGKIFPAKGVKRGKYIAAKGVKKEGEGVRPTPCASTWKTKTTFALTIFAWHRKLVHNATMRKRCHLEHLLSKGMQVILQERGGGAMSF